MQQIKLFDYEKKCVSSEALTEINKHIDPIFVLVIGNSKVNNYIYSTLLLNGPIDQEADMEKIFNNINKIPDNDKFLLCGPYDFNEFEKKYNNVDFSNEVICKNKNTLPENSINISYMTSNCSFYESETTTPNMTLKDNSGIISKNDIVLASSNTKNSKLPNNNNSTNTIPNMVNEIIKKINNDNTIIKDDSNNNNGNSLYIFNEESDSQELEESDKKKNSCFQTKGKKLMGNKNESNKIIKNSAFEDEIKSFDYIPRIINNPLSEEKINEKGYKQIDLKKRRKKMFLITVDIFEPSKKTAELFQYLIACMIFSNVKLVITDYAKIKDILPTINSLYAYSTLVKKSLIKRSTCDSYESQQLFFVCCETKKLFQKYTDQFSLEKPLASKNKTDNIIENEDLLNSFVSLNIIIKKLNEYTREIIKKKTDSKNIISQLYTIFMPQSILLCPNLLDTKNIIKQINKNNGNDHLYNEEENIFTPNNIKNAKNLLWENNAAILTEIKRYQTEYLEEKYLSTPFQNINLIVENINEVLKATFAIPKKFIEIEDTSKGFNQIKKWVFVNLLNSHYKKYVVEHYVQENVETLLKKNSIADNVKRIDSVCCWMIENSQVVQYIKNLFPRTYKNVVIETAVAFTKCINTNLQKKQKQIQLSGAIEKVVGFTVPENYNNKLKEEIKVLFTNKMNELIKIFSKIIK